MRRVRLTFVSEFDWRDEKFDQRTMDEIMELFMETPESWVSPIEDDEVVFISVEDITEETSG